MNGKNSIINTKKPDPKWIWFAGSENDQLE